MNVRDRDCTILFSTPIVVHLEFMAIPIMEAPKNVYFET